MFRRDFIKTGLTAAGGPFLARAGLGSSSPGNRIIAGVIGVRGRGNGLLAGFRNQEDVDIKYVSDVDDRVLRQRTQETEEATGRRPDSVKDFRRILDDDEVDVIVLGTPDHWHALPSIWACQAGKDVYVEKPDSHNILESRTMLAAARKYRRVIQLGTQARSSDLHGAAMRYIREGHLGRAVFAKAWESDRQGGIGHPPDEDPPSEVDYDLWLGPAPERPFNPRRFHGSWRWFFDYGTGDLGNDGIHRLDYAIWGLNTLIQSQGGKPLGLPRSVSAHGGKHYFDDDQEWPDNLMVTFDYPGYLITYEMRLWTPYPMHGLKEGALICGDQGYMVIGVRSWAAFDPSGEKAAGEEGAVANEKHIRNFLDCVRSREKPAADLEEAGHLSSMLCHLGNAAWKTGRTLQFDSKSGTFTGDEEANRHLTRPAYRAPFLLPAFEEL